MTDLINIANTAKELAKASLRLLHSDIDSDDVDNLQSMLDEIQDAINDIADAVQTAEAEEEE